jgi:uncharacterized protein (UPF0210 family)
VAKEYRQQTTDRLTTQLDNHSTTRLPNHPVTLMKIRSLTYFTNPGWPIKTANLQQAADFITAARSEYEEAGFEVQTARLATPPFPTLLPDCKPATVTAFAQELESRVSALGFEYTSIGPALLEIPESYAAIPEVIAGTDNTFASGVMVSPKDEISLSAVRACAQVIQRLSPQDPNGFANLYFAALANVPPGAPFFPAAYHDDEGPAFAIATEAADLAVTAFSQATSLAEARGNLMSALEANAHRLCSAAERLTRQFTKAQNLRFGGIDYSLAPFPEIELSLGTAMERLGVPKVGNHGSLAAAAFLADIIDQADFPHTGFSGMMLPVLEDATLAARASQGTLNIKDLLLYSAVCGTGLDTVPLPGDTTTDQLAALLLDLAALATRLDKPLTARLMPIPGKRAGDPTDFDFPFFANSRVMALEAAPLVGNLAGEESFRLGTRKR